MISYVDRQQVQTASSLNSSKYMHVKSYKILFGGVKVRVY